MKIYWKITKKLNYKKSLQTLSYHGEKFDKTELFTYLTSYIFGIVENEDFIYVGFDSNKDNFWKTFWTWSLGSQNGTPFNPEESAIYGGVINSRKEKLKKLNTYSFSDENTE